MDQPKGHVTATQSKILSSVEKVFKDGDFQVKIAGRKKSISIAKFVEAVINETGLKWSDVE